MDVCSERKRHINFFHINFPGPPFVPGIVPGTNRVCPRDKPGEIGLPLCKIRRKPGFVPGFHRICPRDKPGEIPGQTRGRPKTNRTKKFMLMCLFLAWVCWLKKIASHGGGFMLKKGTCNNYMMDRIFWSCLKIRSGPGICQTKERSVHELFAGAFRNQSSMWIALVFLGKNTRIHKKGRNSWTFLRFEALSLVWFAGATPEKKIQEVWDALQWTPEKSSCP